MPYFKEEIQRHLMLTLLLCVLSLITSSHNRLAKTQAIANQEIIIELNANELLLFHHIQKNAKNISTIEMYQTAKTIHNEANKYSIDPLLILAMITEESRFNAKAQGLHGEIGLLQILPKTAKWIGQKAGIEYSSAADLNNPIINIKIGVAYLAWLKTRFDDRIDYISAYNMGPKNVRRFKNSDVQPSIYFNKINSHYIKYTSEYANIGDKNITGRFYAFNN